MSRKVRYGIIPVAGDGTRMAREVPLANVIPKCLLPISFNKSSLDYAIDLLMRAAVEKIFIVVNRQNIAPIYTYIEQKYEPGKFEFIIQKEQRGLSGAIYCCKEHIGDNCFMVVLGDIATNTIVNPAITLFENAANIMVMQYGQFYNIEHPRSSVKETCQLKCNQYSGRLERIYEKANPGVTNIEGIGIYLCDPGFMKELQDGQMQDAINYFANINMAACYIMSDTHWQVNLNTKDDYQRAIEYARIL